MGLDLLADPILLELLCEAPQLGLVNRRLYRLSEYFVRRKLLSYFNHDADQIERLADDVGQFLELTSWAAAAVVAKRDYWFFGLEHVKSRFDPMGESIHSSSPSNGSRKQDGRFYSTHGAPYGLQVCEWGDRCLDYTTSLRCGYYKVYLNLEIKDLRDLGNLRMVCGPVGSVRPAFASVPFSKRQANLYEDAKESGITSLEPDVFTAHIFVGVLEIGGQDHSEWTDVALRLEPLDMFARNNGVVFNFLTLERCEIPDDIMQQWLIQRTENLSGPSQALPALYKRINERKLVWSREGSHTNKRPYNVNGDCALY